ncbi:hypothetical protein ACFFJN_03830, partial [Erwinia mallotivora]|uniref:hypothetical protein n=1 Tax=Erwinia mallotivora TaxID=69222 RepID=UPI0035E7D835
MNNGFGTGWSLSSTRYDLQNRVLTKQSGESFKSEAVIAGREVVLIDGKLKNFRFVSQNNNLFYVYNKDGTVETLQRINLSSPLALTGVLEILCHSSIMHIKRNDTCPNPSISTKRLRHSS